jgi:transposase-like protein
VESNLRVSILYFAKQFHERTFDMKSHFFHTLLGAMCLAFVFAGEDALQKLNITKEKAEEYIGNSLEGGYFQFPYTARKIAAGARVEIVKGIGALAQAYTKTEAFNKWYQELRERKKPKPGELMKTAAENRKEMVASLKKSVADMEKQSAQSSADVKKMLKESIESTKKMIKEQEKPDPEQDKLMDTYTQQANEQIKKQDAEKLAQWEQEYPKDAKPFVKKRLQEFLEFTATVDFNAQLVEDKEGKFMKSANPAYEQKDGKWKQCYRIGKEPVEAARSIVSAWIKQL